MSRSNVRRRRRGERNPIVACRCGCGARFRRFDGVGRWRAFVPGHNRLADPSAPKRDEVLRVLRRSKGGLAVAVIAERAKMTVGAVRWHLTSLGSAGVARPIRWGVWQLADRGCR